MSQENPCEICEKQPSKYCCPKCNVLYCSLTCYKDQKHSECSEEFYRKNVVEELKLQTGTEDTKHQMLEMISRFEAEQAEDEEEIEELDSDDEISEDLADRLKDIDLEDADSVWEKLTDSERQHFQSMVDSGEIVNLMPTREPWYVCGKGIPPSRTSIPDFAELSSKAPAANVKFNLVNVLAAYSYMTRYFMCDYENFLSEACTCLCLLSGALKKNCDLSGIDVAVKMIFVEPLGNEFEVDAGMESVVVADVRKILSRQQYTIAALSDMHGLMRKVKKLPPSTTTAKKEGKFTKKFQDNVNQIPRTYTKETWTSALKRLEYFLSYTQSFMSELTLLL